MTTPPELTIPSEAYCMGRASQQLPGLYTNPPPYDLLLRSTARLRGTQHIYFIKKLSVGLGGYWNN